MASDSPVLTAPKWTDRGRTVGNNVADISRHEQAIHPSTALSSEAVIAIGTMMIT